MNWRVKLFLLLLLAPCARADKPLELDVPLAIGHDAKGVRIRITSPESEKLQMVLDSAVAFRLDPLQLQLTRVKVETFDDAGNPEMTIDMPQSVFNLKSRILTSKDPVTVRRPNFEMTGSQMVFDTQTRQGKFKGPVRVLVYRAKTTENAPR